MEEPEAAPTPNISVTGVAEVSCPPGVASDRHCFEYTFENRGGHGTTTCSFRRSIHVKAHMFGDHRFMDHDSVNFVDQGLGELEQTVLVWVERDIWGRWQPPQMTCANAAFDSGDEDVD
jgi:hypothetical protein